MSLLYLTYCFYQNLLPYVLDVLIQILRNLFSPQKLSEELSYPNFRNFDSKLEQANTVTLLNFKSSFSYIHTGSDITLVCLETLVKPFCFLDFV